MVTIQTGIKQNRKNYQNFCYWLNGVDVTDQNLDQFTPYITGVSRLFVHKMPPVMETLDPDMSNNFRTLLETGYTRIDGIQDTNVEFVDFEGGFAGQKFRNVSLVSNETDTITISLYEQTGSPVREYIDTWVNAARDQRSGIAHYHGAFDLEGGGVSYGERNHTAEFVYVVMDPTGRSIEYACLFAHAFPTKVPKSHLNFEARNRANVLMDVEFAVTMYESPAINALAAYYLINSQVEYNYLNFKVAKPTNGFRAPQRYSTGNTVGTFDPEKSADTSNAEKVLSAMKDSYGNQITSYTDSNGTEQTDATAAVTANNGPIFSSKASEINADNTGGAYKMGQMAY